MLSKRAKNNYLAISFCLLLSQSVLANVSKPDACPSISALRSTTIQQASPYIHKHDAWIAWADGLFSTHENWTFSTIVDAYTNDQAIEIANHRLQHLTYNEGPFPNRQGGWKCNYYIDGNNLGEANTLCPF